MNCCGGDSIDYAAHTPANPSIVKARLEQQRLKKELEEFFVKHAPAQKHTASAMAMANRGREDTMWAELNKRYVNKPTTNTTTRDLPKATSMCKTYGDKIFKTTFRTGTALGFNVNTSLSGITVVERIKLTGQGIEKCLQDGDEILKIGDTALTKSTSHSDVVRMFKSVTSEKFEVKLKRKNPKDGHWYENRINELNAFYKKHAKAKSGDGATDFQNFGLLFLEKALMINYKEGPENWARIRKMMEENRIVKFGDGPMGMNLAPVDVIVGVQRGMTVKGVDPKGVAAGLGVKVGDIIWGLNSEGFSDEACVSTKAFASAIKSMSRPLNFRFTSLTAKPAAGSTI